jgi:hypothetical protein
VNPALTPLLGLLAPDLVDDATEWLREAADEDPAKTLVTTTLIASHLFYKAEVGVNPKVKSLNDALVFISTCLSVGYCDIFAMTDRGKQIASFIMILGPALSPRALDAPRAAREAAAAAAQTETEAHNAQLLARLDRIAALLEARPAGDVTASTAEGAL